MPTPLPNDDEGVLNILSEEIGELVEELDGDGQLRYRLITAGERATHLLVRAGGSKRGVASHGKITELAQVGGVILLWLAKEIAARGRCLLVL